MTVHRLLREADSAELSAWQAFLVAESTQQQAELEARRAERSITGD